MALAIRHRTRITDAVLAMLLGASTFWRIAEQDIYWQIRAGDDLLTAHSFPTTETWSSTAAGAPWRNFQWLGTLLLRGAYGVGEEAALVALRGLLAGALMMVLARTTRRALTAMEAKGERPPGADNTTRAARTTAGARAEISDATSFGTRSDAGAYAPGATSLGTPSDAGAYAPGATSLGTPNDAGAYAPGATSLGAPSDAAGAPASARRSATTAFHWRREATVLTVVPLAFVALIPRIQVRPDFFVCLLFAILLSMWTGTASLKRCACATAGGVLLAANLHPGAAVFVLLASLAWTLQQTGWTVSRRGAFCVLLAALFFTTPYGFNTIPFLLDHLQYAQHILTHNPDHEAFTLTSLYTTAHGAPCAWVLLTALAALGLCVSRGISCVLPAPDATSDPRTPTPVPPWRYAVVNLVMVVVLLALALNRTRAVPYAVVYALPLTIFGLAMLTRRHSGAAVGIAAAACVWALVAIVRLSSLLGFDADRSVFPVESTRFLQQTQPQGNIFHLFGDGAYLVWNLRAYKDYVDTRETPFWPLQDRLRQAMRDPRAMAALLAQDHINTTLLPTIPARATPHGWRSFSDAFLPADTWALVSFDDLTQVRVRRIPAHGQLIAAHGYALLDSSYPPDFYRTRPDRTPTMDDRLREEVQRCLRQDPTNGYCNAVAAVTAPR